MGRKSRRAKTKTVLKSVSKMQQLGSMRNLEFQTLANKNHPTTLNGCNCFASGKDNRENDFRRRSAFKESENLVPIYGEQLQYTHFLQ